MKPSRHKRKIKMSTRITSSYQSNLAQQLVALSPAKRSLLELRLMRKNRRQSAKNMTIPRQPNRESAPLSYNQQGLWVLNQLMPGTSLYHTPMAVRLTGNLDVAALKSALDMVIARHDALRTTFGIVDESPKQVVAKSLLLDMPIIDLIEIPQPGRDAEAQRLLQDEAGRPFDLSQGPLIRSVLLRLGEREHILLVTTHHIVTDGWSVGIFQRELSALYGATVDEQQSSLPQLPIQYSDYSIWQREWFEGDVYQSQLAYWKRQFATLPAVLELPADHPRPGV